MNFRPADNGSMTDSGVSVASWPWSETGTSGTPKGVHFTKCCDFRRFPWRWVIFPVEVSLGLYLFTIFFLMQLLQQYAFQRIANDAFMEYSANHNVSNSSLFNVSQCWNQDRIVDLTSEDTFTHIQAETNRMNTIFFLSFFLPSSLMVLALGPLSDAFGRKTFMVLALVGQAVSSALSLAIVYFQLNLMVFVASECASGVFGGAGAMYALTFAYASDATPKRWLTARIGLLEAAAFVAIAISSSTSFRWIEYTDCNFVPPSSLVVGIAVLAILFTLFIPESLPRHRRTKQLRQNRGGCIRELFNGLKIFFWPWYIEFGTFWRLWVLLLVMCIRVMNDIGLMQIISYFLHNKPLSWNYPLIGTFETVDSMARGLCLIVLLPILVVAKFSDIFIGLVGILFSIGCAIFIALLESTWEMFLVGVLNGVAALTAPIVRSMMAKLIPAHEQGAAFSVITFFQVVASCISTVMYNYIYYPGAAGSGSQSSGTSKYSFWLMAILSAATIPLLIMLLPCCTCQWRARSLQFTTTAGEQREHLLALASSGSSTDSSLDDF